MEVCVYLMLLADNLKIEKLVTVGAADKISDVILNFTSNLKVKPIISKKIKNIFDKKWETNIDLFSSSIVANKDNDSHVSYT